MNRIFYVLLILFCIACAKEPKEISEITTCGGLDFCSYIVSGQGNQQVRAGLNDNKKQIFFSADHQGRDYGLLCFVFEDAFSDKQRIEISHEFFPLSATQNNTHYFLAGYSLINQAPKAAVLAIHKTSRSTKYLGISEGIASRFNDVVFYDNELHAVGWIRDSTNQNYLKTKIPISFDSAQHWIFQKEGTDALVAIVTLGSEMFCLGHEYNEYNRDISILRFDADAFSWKKSYGSPAYEEAQDMILSSDEHLIVAAHSAKNDPLHDAWCLKIDWQGELIWEQYFGVDKHDGCEAVIETNSGDLLFVTRSESFSEASDVYTLKLDAQGNLIQELVISEKDINEAYVVLASEKKFILAGTRKDETSGIEDAHFVFIPH